ncbi:apelin receptor-like [Clytia hemisphaerica]|uniref:G-protein coupled receptors family 1 profile domain-containing protein n=1 Tax=Clytia hemisphaerica TaxID=252671 RepID=A0A7M5UXM3_9CNID
MFSNEADDEFLYWFSRIVYPFFSIGIIGNLLIIIYHMHQNWGDLRKMSSYNFFIMQLAFADLVVCVTTPAMRYEEQKPVFQAGHFTCKYIRPSTLLVAPMASCWILVGLSYFRYLVLRHNFNGKISKIHITIVCFAFWFLSAVYYYMAFDSNGINENDQCDYGKIYKNMDAMLVFVFVFERFLDCFLPTILMTICFRSIRNHIMEHAAVAIIPVQMRMRRLRAVQTLKWLIICYVFFVFPGRTLVTIFRLMNHFKVGFHGEKDELILDVVYHCMLFCINLNNMVNVFIFLRMDNQFRQFLSTPFVRFGLFLRCNVAVPVGNAFNCCVGGAQPEEPEAPLDVIVNQNHE